MSGDHLYISRQLRRDFFERIDHTSHAAAAGHVDEWETISDEIVSHVYDVRFRKEDNAVAVGVSRREVQRADVLAVQVDRHVVIEGDDGQSGFRCGLEWEA